MRFTAWFLHVPLCFLPGLWKCNKLRVPATMRLVAPMLFLTHGELHLSNSAEIKSSSFTLLLVRDLVSSKRTVTKYIELLRKQSAVCSAHGEAINMNEMILYSNVLERGLKVRSLL